MLKSRVFAITGTLAVAGGAVIAAALPAAAAPHVLSAVRATTQITGRPDSGNGGTWAYDGTPSGPMTRTITITRTGGSPGAWTYTASLTDKGTFTAITGALTPNQGAPYTGDTIRAQFGGGPVGGTLNGAADYSFTASTLPNAGPNAGVPAAENDHGGTSGFSTSAWYEQAFPAGTVFSGPGIGHWSWTYRAVVASVKTQGPNPVLRVAVQQWVDAYDNGDGNQPQDGNIG